MKKGWVIVKLKKVLKQYRITVWIDDTKQYNQLTNSKHTGIKARGYKIGSEIGRKRQFVVDLDKHPNTILFTRQTIQQDEAIGLCPYEVNGCIVTENMPLFAVENADPNFIEHYFKTETFLKQLHLTAAIGTSQQSILEETFLNFEIPLPPLSEQQRIAGRLAALKGKIDAVRALRGEQVREVERVTQNFGEQFFEELGKEVPTKLFEEICDVVRGGSPRPAGDPTFYGDGYLPFLKIGDVTNDNEIYVQGYAETLTKAGLTKTRVVEPNTLLLTNSGATLGVPKITAFKTAFNDGIQAFINFKEDVNLEYLYFFLKSKTGHFRKILARGQGQPNLNTEMVKKTSIPLPSLSEQHRIVSEIKAFQTKTQALKAAQAGQLSALEGLFPGVLEQAFRGEW